MEKVQQRSKIQKKMVYLFTFGTVLCFSLIPTGLVFAQEVDSQQKVETEQAFNKLDIIEKNDTSTYDGGASLSFVNADGEAIGDGYYWFKSGLIGESYDFSNAEIPEKFSENGVTYLRDNDSYQEFLKVQKGLLTLNSLSITIKYNTNVTPTYDGGATLSFVNADGEAIGDGYYWFKSGLIGESYDFSNAEIPEKFSENGVTYLRDNDSYQEFLKVQKGLLTLNSLSITIKYNTDVTPISANEKNGTRTTASLPQTGETTLSLLTVIGSMILLASGAYVLTLKGKKK